MKKEFQINYFEYIRKYILRIYSFILERYIISLPPLYRRLIFILADICILIFSNYLALWICPEYSDYYANSHSSIWISPLIIIVGTIIYIFTGQYKGLTRYSGSNFLYSLISRNISIIIGLYFLSFIFKLSNSPFKFYLIFLLFSTCIMGTLRLLARDELRRLHTDNKEIKNVIIYGAGSAGAQLAASLRLAGKHNIKAFIDDSPRLWNRNLSGIPIKPTNFIENNTHKIDQILLAIPSLSITRRRQILEELQRFGIRILNLPPLEKLLSNNLPINTLLPINIEELLGRDPVEPDIKLLNKSIDGFVVCVIGCGGSIGSELCRQIIGLSPKSLILFDISELNLYNINKDLSKPGRS